MVSNLTRAEANSNHAVSSACWLTGVPPKRTDGPDFRVGVSVDQVIARRIGPFPEIVELDNRPKESFYVEGTK